MKSIIVLFTLLLLVACSGGGSDPATSDAAVSNVEGAEFAAVCGQEPFLSRTTGVYKGIFVDEYPLSRCEFDVTITIDEPASLSRHCIQRGTLSYTGTQTFVHPTEPRECGTIDEPVSIIWSPNNIDQETGEVFSDMLEYPIRLEMGFANIPPNVSESGNQLEQLLSLGLTFFNVDGNIEFVDIVPTEGVLAEFVRQ